MAKRPETADGEKLIVKNRRATFDYAIEERYEAGISLLGGEVKSLRAGTADITDAWASVDRGQVLLKNLTIQPVPHAAFAHEPRRVRKLLLHAREIEEIRKETDHNGAQLIPMRLYFKQGRVKVELAIAHARKKGDKREVIKTREADREARAAVRRGRKDL